MDRPNHGLGRLPERDARDSNFLARALVPTAMLTGYKYWPDPHWNDQDGHGTCVGHNTINWWEDSPITHPEVEYDPIAFYQECCLRDPWTDNDDGNLDAGTSVHAAGKVMRSRGMISQPYLWAHDLTTVVNWLLTKGPVLVGTTWFASMDATFWKSGYMMMPVDTNSMVLGGHCYIWNGVNTNTKVIRAKLGSWNRSLFGDNGRAYLTFEDASKLIADAAEVMCVTEGSA